MKKKVLFGLIVAMLVGVAATFTIIAINSNKVEPDEPEVTVTEEPKKKSTVAFINKDAKLSDIKKIDGVVNVYMFWGNGCPHCKAQWEWLESIRDEYTGTVAVYGFEVFNSQENRNIMNKFSIAAGDGEVNTVPYTIIGNQRFDSFGNGSTTGKKILEAIKKAQKSGVDLYFDKKIK